MGPVPAGNVVMCLRYEHLHPTHTYAQPCVLANAGSRNGHAPTHSRPYQRLLR